METVSLYLLHKNKNCSFSNVTIIGSPRPKKKKPTEFNFLRSMKKKTSSKITSEVQISTPRNDLLRELSRLPWEPILKSIGTQKCCEIFRCTLLKAQEMFVSISRGNREQRKGAGIKTNQSCWAVKCFFSLTFKGKVSCQLSIPRSDDETNDESLMVEESWADEHLY